MFSVFAQYIFLLSAYPLARWILPKIKSRQNSIILHITIGLAVCSLLYKTRFVLAFLMLTIGYYFLDSNPYFVFAYAFFMHISFHIFQLLSPNHVQIKGFTRILFCKIVATSFNLYDSKKLNSKDKEYTPHQRICALTKKPTYAEWLAYCLTPFGSISPSFYEFRLFEWILNLGTNSAKVSDKSRIKAINCLKQSFIHFTIYFAFRHYFSLSFYKSEFYLSLNVLFRILIMLFLGVIILNRFFMQWKAVDAGLYEAGLEDSKLLPEEEFTSLTLLNLLSKSNIKDYGKAFNHTNNIFWSDYLNSRGPDSGIPLPIFDTIKVVIKPFFIGLDGAYFLGPFERKLFSAAENVLHIYAPMIVACTFWIEYIFTQVFMIASKASIRFKTIYAFFYMNYVIYFVFWFIASAMVIAEAFLCKKTETENAVNETKEDQQHFKNE